MTNTKSLPPDVTRACREINAFVIKLARAEKDIDNYQRSIGQHIRTIKKKCPKDWLAIIERQCNLKKTRIYELLQIDSGHKTPEQIRGDANRRKIKHRVSVPERKETDAEIEATGGRAIEPAKVVEVSAEAPQVPLNKNPICHAWRLAFEDERAEFAHLFGDDVRRYADDTDHEPSPAKTDTDEGGDAQETDSEPAQARRGKKPKVVSYEEILGNAIGAAFEKLTELAEECREIVDSAEGGLSETQRIQTLGETADALEGLNAPDVPAELSEIKVAYDLPKRRYTSRASRASDAFTSLSACVDVLGAIPEGDPRHQQAVNLLGELENAASEAEACEFPGMYG